MARYSGAATWGLTLHRKTEEMIVAWYLGGGVTVFVQY